MKKFLMIVSFLMVTANANAAFVFQGQAQAGAFLNCAVGNNTVMPYRVVQVQYNFSCMDIYRRVFSYNPIYNFNDIASYVNPGQVKVFPGPALAGCNLVGASCTVLAE